ncbi:YgfZ/GcvT domain-containing protein [Qipengyuania sphaerica]|uniref:CAF17-like 4Fe-4S cluster assembly/insertion protein YgfZ n=1 Tax=Qipengyuania sphaerica TaxID=2867243 RepID=UPI001C8672F7|nr:folate-binding protein [Qipengyuania sphaerica]MBX7540970.1 folate-binding protein [Qipengyuania sphaerica]
MTATRLMNRAVIRLTPEDEGENVADFLQGLLTNDVKGKLPAYAGLLTPQGKALFDMIVWPAGDGQLLLDCEAEFAEDLAKRLKLYRLRRKIAIEVDEGVAVHWEKHGGDGGAPDPRLSALGQRWLAPVSDNYEAADEEYRAHRLAMGVPETRAELGDILWLETNAVELHGVAFDKGCYIGQENTARMNWRSKVNRRLVVVPLEQSDEKRRKVAYEDLGLAVDHLRVSDIDPENAPEWMRSGLTAAEQ